MDLVLLLYDDDCSICIRFRKVVDFLDVERKIDFVSIDQAEQAGFLDALPDRRRHASFHLILADKSLESGAEALPDLIRLLPAGRLVSKVIVSVPGGRKGLNFLYSAVARLHEVGSCKLHSAASAVYAGNHNFSGREALP